MENPRRCYVVERKGRNDGRTAAVLGWRADCADVISAEGGAFRGTFGLFGGPGSFSHPNNTARDHISYNFTV